MDETPRDEALRELDGTPPDAEGTEPTGSAPRQAQSTPVASAVSMTISTPGNNNQVIVAPNGATVIPTQDNSRNNRDIVSGNKTEQVGVKGDNNTVGGLVNQNIGKQDTPKKVIPAAGLSKA